MLMAYWRLPVQKLRLREWALALSMAAMTMLMSWRGGFVLIAMGVAGSFLITLTLSRRLRLWDAAWSTSLLWRGVAGVFALVWDVRLGLILQREYVPIFAQMKRFALPPELHGLILNACVASLALLALPALFCLLAVSLPRLFRAARSFGRSLSLLEKRFLFCFLCFGSLLVVFLYSLTNCFYLPVHEGALIQYDVLFTSDTGVLVHNDVFVNIGAIQNDINQMLFGPIAIPLGLTCTLISWLLFFIPNSYAYALAIAHVALMGVTLLMLARLMGLEGGAKLLFLCVLTACYPTLLFLVNLEQYVISTFCLVGFLYSAFHNQRGKDLFFLAAAGTLATSGALFPLFFMEKGFKRNFLHLLWAGVCFGMLVTVFGKLPYLLNIFAKQGELMNWYGGGALPFSQKLAQYLRFPVACLFAPSTLVNLEERGFPRLVLDQAGGIDPLGLAVLLLSVVGLALCHRQWFARVCGGWIAFSFFVLCLMGWGTAENGLILYSFYFGWAFAGLCFLAIEQLFTRIPLVKRILQGALLASLLLCNGAALVELARFGMQYYPA